MPVKRFLALLFVLGLCAGGKHLNEHNEWVDDDTGEPTDPPGYEQIHNLDPPDGLRPVEQRRDLDEQNPDLAAKLQPELQNAHRDLDELDPQLLAKSQQELEEARRDQFDGAPVQQVNERPALLSQRTGLADEDGLDGENRGPSLIAHEQEEEGTHPVDQTLGVPDSLTKSIAEAQQEFEQVKLNQPKTESFDRVEEHPVDHPAEEELDQDLHSAEQTKHAGKKAAHLSSVQAGPMIGAPGPNDVDEFLQNRDESGEHKALQQPPEALVEDKQPTKEAQPKPHKPVEHPVQERPEKLQIPQPEKDKQKQVTPVVKKEEKPVVPAISEADKKKQEELRKQEEKKKEEEKARSAPKKPLTVTEIIIHVFMAVTGAYVCLFGFRAFRLLMIILGFYTSYYVILFFLSEFDVYETQSLGHQLGVFFGSIVLGFFVAMVCYVLDRINFFVFGLAVGCVMGLFYAQFFVDFDVTRDRLILLAIVLGVAALLTIAAFFMLDQAIIWGSALVGAVICPINVGVLLGDFDSFEDRRKLPLDAFADFKTYLIVCGALLLAGVGCQYYLRSRIISHMHEENLNKIRGESFLN